MRMAVVIEPTAFLEARGLDDEGVAFPLADRVAVPRGLFGINRQLPPVGVNLPVLVEFLEQKNRNALHLQDLERDPRNRHRIGRRFASTCGPPTGLLTARRRYQTKERVQLLCNGVTKQKNASNYFATAFLNKTTGPITF